MNQKKPIDLATFFNKGGTPRAEVIPETTAPTIETHQSIAADNAQTCTGCSAPLDSNDHFCPNCGTSHPAQAEIAFVERQGKKKKTTPKENLTCTSCGSEVSSLGSKRSMKCPFCDTTFVSQKPTLNPNRKEPEFVIGFAVDQTRAATILESWFGKSGWFHPKNLANKKVINEIKGVYVPFWSFSTLATSRWSADIGEDYYETETYTTTGKGGKLVTRTRRVRRTEWYPLTGRHHQYYSGYLVSGSKGLSQKEADSILPYNMPAAQRYQPYFLAGWFCEEYSRGPEEALKISQQVFYDWEYRNIHAFLPGDRSNNLRTETTFHKTQSDLFLLPVYLMSYTFDEKRYRVFVNGQTGKISGTKPYSAKRIGIAIGLVVLLIILIALVVLLLNSLPAIFNG